MKIKIVLIFILYHVNSNIIKLPFKLRYTDINNSISFYDYIINNKPITEILIGTPPQKIPLKIYFDGHPLVISGKDTNGIYNKNISSTYEKIGETICSNEDFKTLIESKETVFINDKKINNFTFVYPFLSKNNNNESYFGLVYHYYEISNYYLAIQLSERNVISSNIYIFDYINDYEGYLILGDYFHNFNSSYIRENFIQISNEVTVYSFSWNLKFDKILYDNIEIIQKEICYIDPSFNGIILNKDFYDKIKNNFFKEYLNNQKCDVKTINNISYFECDDNIDINNFHSLKFYHNNLNYTFILNSNDVFMRKNKKVCFKIILNEQKPNQCLIGVPLIKKYKMNFDQARKTMGLYTKLSIDINLLNWFIIFILFLFCIFLIYNILKLMHHKRKKRLNEIEDIYDYIPN